MYACHLSYENQMLIMSRHSRDLAVAERMSKRVSSSPWWSLVCYFMDPFFLFWYHMRLGASGTGRTTFVNTLCGSNVLAKKVCDNPEEAHNEPGITIKPMSVGKYLHDTCDPPRHIFNMQPHLTLSFFFYRIGWRWCAVSIHMNMAYMNDWLTHTWMLR